MENTTDFIYGKNAVIEALNSGNREINKILISKNIHTDTKIDKIKEENSLKVLKAFQNNQISEMHFNSTTGYGYGDVGRDAIEAIFAEVLGAGPERISRIRKQAPAGCSFSVSMPVFCIMG